MSAFDCVSEYMSYHHDHAVKVNNSYVIMKYSHAIV